MLHYTQYQSNNNLIYELGIFQLVADKIYQRISSADKYYPNFREWYYDNVIPSVLSGDKEFIFETRQNKIVGLAIIKHSEQKLCHLSIFEEYQNKGYGLKLFKKSFQKLKTNKPYLTVSEEKYQEFEKIFKYFNFSLVKKEKGIYREDKFEYYFNTKDA